MKILIFVTRVFVKGFAVSNEESFMLDRMTSLNTLSNPPQKKEEPPVNHIQPAYIQQLRDLRLGVAMVPIYLLLLYQNRSNQHATSFPLPPFSPACDPLLLYQNATRPIKRYKSKGVGTIPT